MPKKSMEKMGRAELAGVVATNLSDDAGLARLAKFCGGDLATQKNFVRAMKEIRHFYEGPAAEPAEVKVETIDTVDDEPVEDGEEPETDEDIAADD